MFVSFKSWMHVEMLSKRVDQERRPREYDAQVTWSRIQRNHMIKQRPKMNVCCVANKAHMSMGELICTEQGYATVNTQKRTVELRARDGRDGFDGEPLGATVAPILGKD